MQESKRQRIVIKIGTSSITGKDGINVQNLRLLCRQAVLLKKGKYEPIIVTSGAIGQGMHELGMKKRPKDVPTQQAAAAVGQSALVEAYKKELSKYKLKAAQILLTQEDFIEKVRQKNLLKCLRRLEKLTIPTIPIVNENDVTAVYELSHGKIFSDNDMLSALLAAHVGAKLLIILKSVDGIYTKSGEILRNVRRIEDLENIAKLKGSELGRGGIITTIEAAKYAAKHGVKTIVTKLTEKSIIDAVEGKCSGTVFHPYFYSVL